MADTTERSITEAGEVHNDGHEPAMGGPSKGGEVAGKQRRWLKPLVLLLVLAALALGATEGVAYLEFAKTHVSTDDAYLTSDVIQISPQVNGTVSSVLVEENQHVRRGQLLATLDDSTYRAAMAQAQANLDAAIAQAKGAGATVAVTSQSSSGQVVQAQGGVVQAEGAIEAARADVARARAAVATAIATASGAQANVSTADAGVKAALASRQRAQAGYQAALAQLETSRAAVGSAQAAVDAAQANYQKAAKDLQRYTMLLAQGAVQEQLVDQARAAADTAKAQLDGAKQQVAQAQAAVAAAQANVDAAKEQVSAANAAVDQAKAQAAAAREQAAAADAGIRQAKAQQAAAEQGVRQAEAKRVQALGQLRQAKTAPAQVAVSRSNQAQANARIEQARAALRSAELQLSYTRIYAPADGRVSNKTVQVGALVQPGTPLMAIVPDERVWVEANFKETQLTHMKPGQSATVTVDAFPGRTFRAHVESLSPATGATFSLLPPENATGNFTKVVQRVPVRILFEPGQRGLSQLRAGMSVTATVETR